MADRDAILEKHFPAPDGYDDARAICNAMDEYMKETCLELLDYMSKNKVKYWFIDAESRQPLYLFKGKYITKEELFENFL
jgi:hypothetical protein